MLAAFLTIFTLRICQEKKCTRTQNTKSLEDNEDTIALTFLHSTATLVQIPIRWRVWHWGILCMFQQHKYFCSLVAQPWAIAFVMELWSWSPSLLINSKSAHWVEDRRRIEKGQQRHALLSPFHPAASFSSHLAPSTSGPSLAKETLWMALHLCKHKATCYAPSLDCASALVVRCPSTIHYQYRSWTQNAMSSCHTLASHISQAEKLKPKQRCFLSSVLRFQKSTFGGFLWIREAVYNLNKHVTSSTVVWIGKWQDTADQASPRPSFDLNECYGSLE